MSLLLDQDALDAARVFFEDRGATGCEGTAMIAHDTDTTATRLVVPEQRAGSAPRCWVEVTDNGKLQLAAALGEAEMYVARIHSHPMDAFHSLTDDENPAITFNGAISIVVPFYGLGLRGGLDNCAVLKFTNGRWVDLPPGPVRDVEVRIR